MSKGVASLTMDSEYLHNRQISKRTERISHVGNGLYYGTKRLGVGILQGVSGVFIQPVKGAQKEGLQGFVKGVGKGIVGAAVKPVVGVGDFLSNTVGGAKATTTAISEFTMIGKSRKRGVAHRTRTPRLIYGSQRLLKVYNEDESYVRAIILAMNMTSTKRVTRDNITFDPKTFLIHEYITHVRMKNVICIITNSWLTLFNTEKIMKSWMKTNFIHACKPVNFVLGSVLKICNFQVPFGSSSQK